MKTAERIPPVQETNNRGKPCYCYQMKGEFMDKPDVCKQCPFRNNWTNITSDGTTFNPKNPKAGTTSVSFVGCHDTELERIRNKYDNVKTRERKILELNNKVRRYTK